MCRELVWPWWIPVKLRVSLDGGVNGDLNGELDCGLNRRCMVSKEVCAEGWFYTEYHRGSVGSERENMVRIHGSRPNTRPTSGLRNECIANNILLTGGQDNE